MKTTLLCAFLSGLATVVSAADAVDIHYEVVFKDFVMATQTVQIVQSAGLKTVSSSFTADLPVFVALHHYSEELSASFRADGTVERLGARIQDGPMQTVIAGSLQADQTLRVIRTDRNGVATNFIAREEYDFNSLALYGTAPADFLPTNRPARVLSVADGIVLPVSIQTISESDTFERQHLASTHLVWTEGGHTSHSWHPERFSNLPRRYIRHTGSGEFTFNLLR
ncbi:MAG TPA: hypothetical protein DCM68_08090 [Verrucomicrobia bacterium]|nr:hypothetical protein [Verrucomicrobiota bacterium]